MSFSELFSVDHKCTEVEIEVSNQCNARCAHCPSSRRMDIKHFMSPEIFKNIIKRYNDYYSKKTKPQFIFSGGGEPLINKNLDEFIKLSSENGYSTKIITNASLLNYSRLRNLVSNGLNEIFVSFHAIKPDEYEKTMKLDYKTSLDNVCCARDYLRAQKTTGTKLAILANELSCVSSTSDEMERFWKDKDICFLRPTPIWNRGGSLKKFEQLVKNSEHHVKINFKLPAWCLIIKYTDIISSTGEFIKCTCDHFVKSISYGNIMDDDLQTVYEKLEAILSSENKPDNCRECIMGLINYRSVGRSYTKAINK